MPALGLAWDGWEGVAPPWEEEGVSHWLSPPLQSCKHPSDCSAAHAQNELSDQLTAPALRRHFPQGCNTLDYLSRKENMDAFDGHLQRTAVWVVGMIRRLIRVCQDARLPGCEAVCPSAGGM